MEQDVESKKEERWLVMDWDLQKMGDRFGIVMI